VSKELQQHITQATKDSQSRITKAIINKYRRLADEAISVRQAQQLRRRIKYELALDIK
jgi:hypothetical protein